MEALYQKLISYSYHIVGSYEDARDLVQDTMEKYIGLEKSAIRDEANYLIRTVINHSINFKKKRNKVAKYGTWLPEPISTDMPDGKIEARDVASYSMMILMEKLTAKERAVFVLKEGFDYSHNEIAELLSVNSANSRKLLARGRKKLDGAVFENERNAGTHHIVEEYASAISNGDIKKLGELFAEEIQLTADGGDKVQVATSLTKGAKKTIEVLNYVFHTHQKHLNIKLVTVNHQPALIYHTNGYVVSCQVFSIEDKKILGIYSVVDPKKLVQLANQYL